MQIILQVFFIFFADKFYVFVFQGVANNKRKKKIAFTQIYKGLVLLYRFGCAFVGLYLCISVDYLLRFCRGCLCAFVGVTFLKPQTISPLQALNP